MILLIQLYDMHWIDMTSNSRGDRLFTNFLLQTTTEEISNFIYI